MQTRTQTHKEIPDQQSLSGNPKRPPFREGQKIWSWECGAEWIFYRSPSVFFTCRIRADCPEWRDLARGNFGLGTLPGGPSYLSRPASAAECCPDWLNFSHEWDGLPDTFGPASSV